MHWHAGVKQENVPPTPAGILVCLQFERLRENNAVHRQRGEAEF